jgi:hypothetical protein
MHHPPVQRRGLGLEDHELLELCAEGWSRGVIAAMMGIAPGEVGARLGALCALLGIAPRPDGGPTVYAARMWLVEQAGSGAVAAA